MTSANTPAPTGDSSSCIGRLIPARNLSDALHANMPATTRVTLLDTSGFTVMKDPLYVLFAIVPSRKRVALSDTSGITVSKDPSNHKTRNLLNVLHANMPATTRVTLLDTSGLTVTKEPSNVMFAILNADLSRGWKATF